MWRKITYPERLKRRDDAAPASDPCAPLWACSSPRSRCRAPPAPWLSRCRTCCLTRATRLLQNLLTAAACASFTGDGEKPTFSGALRTRSFFSALCAPLQSAAPVCRFQAVGVIYLGMASAGGGRSNTSSYPRK